jgi:SAM-dependent methyltransferase
VSTDLRESAEQKLTLLLPKLRCPRSGEPLRRAGDRLENPSGTEVYGLVDGVPDLRAPPQRLHVDVPWYEPWDDLDTLRLAYPEPVDDPTLPYHLDGYLASIVPADPAGCWIAEIGCGERQAEGWFSDRGMHYVGVDIDRRGPGPNVLGDAHNIPLASDSMDYCASMAVFEHVISPISFAREVHRVLKPGGTFFGSGVFVYGFHDRASFHHMSHAGLFYVLKVAGFQVEMMWPDWKYPDAVPAWGFRGGVGAPWRYMTKGCLSLAEWSFTRISNVARGIVGKPKIDLMMRDLSMAGSISFKAVKPG